MRLPYAVDRAIDGAVGSFTTAEDISEGFTGPEALVLGASALLVGERMLKSRNVLSKLGGIGLYASAGIALKRAGEAGVKHVTDFVRVGTVS